MAGGATCATNCRGVLTQELKLADITVRVCVLGEGWQPQVHGQHCHVCLVCRHLSNKSNKRQPVYNCGPCCSTYVYQCNVCRVLCWRIVYACLVFLCLRPFSPQQVTLCFPWRVGCRARVLIRPLWSSVVTHSCCQWPCGQSACGDASHTLVEAGGIA